MYSTLLIFIGFCMSIQFATGFLYFFLGGLRILDDYMNLFRSENRKTMEDKILHFIYLLLFGLGHKSYLSVRKKHSFFKTKLIYGSLLIFSTLVMLIFILPLMDLIGLFKPLDNL